MKIEKTRKQLIVDKLLEEKKINEFEAAELLKEDIPQLPYVQIIPQQPYKPFPQQPYMPSYPFPIPVQEDWKQKWANEEMNRRARIADACSCNPKNGGSGICGCVLTGQIIMS